MILRPEEKKKEWLSTCIQIKEWGKMERNSGVNVLVKMYWEEKNNFHHHYTERNITDRFNRTILNRLVVSGFICM